MKSLQELALEALLKQAPAEELILQNIIKSTFTGVTLQYSLDKLLKAVTTIRSLDEEKKSFSKVSLIQYGIFTTIIEEAEKVISSIPEVDKELDARERLKSVFKQDSLPLPDISTMSTTQGGYVAASGSSNLKNGCYNLMLREQSAGRFALILDCELHHPGQVKVNRTLLNLHQSKKIDEALTSDKVYLWKKNANGFYTRVHVVELGKRSQSLTYLDESTQLKVIIDRGNPGLMSDQARLSISVTEFRLSELEQAQSVLKDVLFSLGVGSIAFPQRPIDRERIQCFSANRLKYLQDVLSYDQERDLRLYEWPIAPLKEHLRVSTEDFAKITETEILPGFVACAQHDLASTLKQQDAAFLYHDIYDLSLMTFDEILERLITIFKDGLCSTSHRYRHGNFVAGVSPREDLESGGGSSVFTRVQKSDQSFTPGSCISIIIDTQVLSLVNSYMYDRDSYGTKKGNTYKLRTSPQALIQSESLQSRLNEFMSKHHIPTSSIVCLAINKDLYEKNKKKFDDAIHQSGILQLTNKKIEDFVITSDVHHRIQPLVEAHHKVEQGAIYIKHIELNHSRKASHGKAVMGPKN